MPASPSPPGSLELRSSAAWVDLGSRGTLQATGGGAAAFVDKFTTAPVGRLGPGEASETFFTDVRGWVLAFATILRTDDGLVIDCDAAVATPLRDHLEHYHIREDVALTDVSATVACLAIVGPEAAAWLRSHTSDAVPDVACRHAVVRAGPCAARAVAVDWFGDLAFLLRVPAADAAALGEWLAAEGLPRADVAAVDALRIEHRLPEARDIPEKTLPQELDRTSRAISFTKGCYLGQETVARLDALGHVNRMLALVVVDGPACPPVGAVVSCHDEPVGTLTSTCLSPTLGPCGIALVHRRGLAPGAPLRVGGATARIGAPSI
jgi:folate-binding protein YgfZ